MSGAVGRGGAGRNLVVIAVLLGVALVLVAWPARGAHSGRADARRVARLRADFAVESDPRFIGILYGPADGPPPALSPDGAARDNADWEARRTRTWYIEEQDVVYPALLRGLREGNVRDLQDGIAAFDWGFRRQAADGSFPGSGNEFHSTSFFVAAVAHVCLFERRAVAAHRPVPAWARSKIESYVARVHAAARWMARSDVWRQGLVLNSPYGHRRFLVGAAVGLTAALTNDATLRRRADEVLANGLRIQRPSGVVPERGGWDSGYQPVGLIYAEQWLAYDKRDRLAVRVLRAIRRGLAWERSRILASGQVLTAGNTRTGGQERHVNGTVKTVSYLEVGRALLWWAVAAGDRASLRVGAAVMGFERRHPGSAG